MSPQFSQNRSIQVRQVPLHIVQPRNKLFADCFFFLSQKKFTKRILLKKIFWKEAGSFLKFWVAFKKRKGGRDKERVNRGEQDSWWGKSRKLQKYVDHPPKKKTLRRVNI